MPRQVTLLLSSLLLVLLVGCAREADAPAEPASQKPSSETREPAPAATETSPAPTAPAPTTTRGAPDRNVVITSPQEGATLTSNPIRIEGRARTFENHVEIRVDDAHGQPIVMRYGTARGEIGHFNPFADEILLTVDPGPRITITAIERSAKDGSIRSSHAVTLRVEARTMPVRLYFPNEAGGGVDCAAVERVVRDVPASLSAARLALEALLRGPTQPEAVAGFRNPFPKEAALRSVNLKRGVLTADFNEAMQNVGGSCRVQSVRASIERTMRELPGVRKVVITAMGDEKTALQP